MKATFGLRIDVDTFRGTRLGVPELCRVLSRFGVRGTFFFSLGPDNMGRHLYRLLRPTFLLKMLRSRAASLYGWDILLRGTLFPGPVIGKNLGTVIQDCSRAGHEIGLHAWDHHAWQMHVEEYDENRIRRDFDRGMDIFRVLSIKPRCSAAPGWRCTDEVLRIKARHYPQFEFNSDCRGAGVFLPRVVGETLPQPQIPVNLPTYDEIVGSDGVTKENYNDFILAELGKSAYNVLTIHAEVEGIVLSGLFESFLQRCMDRGFHPVPLSHLIPEDRKSLPTARIENRKIRGREGWISTRS